MSEKKKHDPEYTLHVENTRDPETSKEITVIAVLSVREFVSFRYEITLAASVSDNIIDLKIHGLRVPENLVPGRGHAQGVFVHTRLKGLFDLMVTNVDGVVNKFSLSISQNDVAVRKLSRNPFIVYSADKVRIS